MYIFNYDTFYNYYTNPINSIRDENECVSLYYFFDTQKKAKKSSKKCNYIIINDTKIYISNVANTNALHFSIPTVINGHAFDFHYHFGKRKHSYINIAHKQYINTCSNNITPFLI